MPQVTQQVHDGKDERRAAMFPDISRGHRGLVLVGYWDFDFLSGAYMPRYLTQHTLACLTRQGAEVLAQRMQSGGTARAERVLVNMLEGKMFVEFRVDSREALEAWLKAEGMHFDWLLRIEWETRDGKL